MNLEELQEQYAQLLGEKPTVENDFKVAQMNLNDFRGERFNIEQQLNQLAGQGTIVVEFSDGVHPPFELPGDDIQRSDGASVTYYSQGSQLTRPYYSQGSQLTRPSVDDSVEEGVDRAIQIWNTLTDQLVHYSVEQLEQLQLVANQLRGANDSEELRGAGQEQAGPRFRQPNNMQQQGGQLQQPNNMQQPNNISPARAPKEIVAMIANFTWHQPPQGITEKAHVRSFLQSLVREEPAYFGRFSLQQFRLLGKRFNETDAQGNTYWSSDHCHRFFKPIPRRGGSNTRFIHQRTSHARLSFYFALMGFAESDLVLDSYYAVTTRADFSEPPDGDTWMGLVRQNQDGN